MLSIRLPVAETAGTTMLITTQTPPIKYIPEATGLGGQLGFNSTGYINSISPNREAATTQFGFAMQKVTAVPSSTLPTLFLLS